MVFPLPLSNEDGRKEKSGQSVQMIVMEFANDFPFLFVLLI